MIQIALEISDKDGKYRKYVAATMISFLIHTNKTITFYVLCDNTLSEINKELLQRTAESKQGQIIFHLVQMDESISYLDSLRKITIDTLFRLLIPQSCAAIDKTVYLDGDILVNKN